MKKLFLLVLIAFVIICCNKEDPDPNPPPINNDTADFVIPNTEDIVMYEVNIRALSSTGDFQGVIQRLDDIKALGANVVWLMPIHPIGLINSVNSPYSVKNYKEVNPEFGTLADFIQLVEKAHELDMAVIIDWVANHTAWDNPWISNTDWYTQDGFGNIIHPPGTNWLDVADLNFDNTDMRASMIDAMNYWVDNTDIDGFRCDAADFVPFSFWQQAITSLKNNTEKELILLAEGSRTDHFDSGFQMNYAWAFYSKLKDVFINNQAASSLISAHTLEYNQIPNGKHKLRFTTNHDESAWDATPMVLFHGKEGSLAASMITSYLGGIPLVYGSQEVGTVENVPFFSNAPINWSQNPDMRAAYEMMFTFYNSSDALRYGDMTPFNHSAIVAFLRKEGAEEVLVLVNTRNSMINFPVPSQLVNSNWKGAFDQVEVVLGESLDFDPYGYLVLIKE